MSQQNDTPFVSLTAGEALEAFRRVKMNGTTARSVVYADAGEDFIGITQDAAASGEQVRIKPRFAPGTFKLTVSADTVAAGATLYGAADGKVSPTISGAPIFIGLERGTANGAIIETVPYLTVSGSAFDWQESVKDSLDFTAAEPADPAVGDRYLNSGAGASSETAQTVAANEIVVWNGTNWTRITPTKGMATMTEDDYEILVFTTSWVNLQTLNQAANVADMDAITAAAKALTAANPDVITAGAVAALTAVNPTLDASDIDDQSGGAASGVHQLVALAGGGADALSDAEALKINANLATIAAEYNSLKDDVEANETAIEAAIVDLGSQKGALDAVIADVASIHTQLTAAVADLGTQKAELDKAIADVTAARTTLNAEIAALKAAGLQASA